MREFQANKLAHKPDGSKTKGKGKGKGEIEGEGKGGGKGPRVFSGTCYNCGIEGHSAKFCPYLGLGFQGNCNLCGLYGHKAEIARDTQVKQSGK